MDDVEKAELLGKLNSKDKPKTPTRAERAPEIAVEEISDADGKSKNSAASESQSSNQNSQSSESAEDKEEGDEEA